MDGHLAYMVIQSPELKGLGSLVLRRNKPSLHALIKQKKMFCKCAHSGRGHQNSMFKTSFITGGQWFSEVHVD